MKKIILAFAVFPWALVAAQNWATEDQYIQKFAPYAVEEMEKYKIPASITLAQGLLETGGGQSRLAREGNNHFGIKCKDDWTGKTMAHTDDAPNECFRVYDDPRDSYEDHSKFLAFRKFYTSLFSLDPKDYRAWAYGLKRAGYATNPKYANILIDKIEKYKLYEFDNTSSKEVLYTVLKLYPLLNNDKIFLARLEQSTSKTKPVTVTVPYQATSYAQQQQVVEKIKSKNELLNSILVKNHPNGGMKFFIAPADFSLSDISQKFGVSVNKLKKWNDLESEFVRKEDIVFLEPKANSGNVDTYKAKMGENMYFLSQKFALKLNKLYSKNRMEPGQEPRPGQVIYLQGKKPRN